MWLFGEDQQLTEIGTMNIFVYLLNDKNEKELITPPLEDGLILPGITRDSILTLCKEWVREIICAFKIKTNLLFLNKTKKNECKITQRRITMKEVQNALKENRLIEIFGAGTACVVQPVYRIKFQNQNIDLPMGDESNKLSSKLINKITEIYYGKIPHKWMMPVDD